MKIDEHTISILKNFSRINNSIIINPGNELKTISPSKNIIAYSKISTVFDKKIVIYDLVRFLSVLNLFTEPELILNDNYITIQSDNKNVNYIYADEEVVSNCKPPKNKLELPNVDVSFELKNEDLKSIEKASNVMNLPEIVFMGDGNDVYIQTSDSKNSTGDVYSIKIGNTDKKFKVIFKKDSIKIIPDDYVVNISKKRISQFIGNHIEYFIAIESNSTF